MNGPEHLALVRDDLERLLDEHSYESLAEAKGSMGLRNSPNPAAFERGNYLRIIEGGMRYV